MSHLVFDQIILFGKKIETQASNFKLDCIVLVRMGDLPRGSGLWGGEKLNNGFIKMKSLGSISIGERLPYLVP